MVMLRYGVVNCDECKFENFDVCDFYCGKVGV